MPAARLLPLGQLAARRLAKLGKRAAELAGDDAVEFAYDSVETVIQLSTTKLPQTNAATCSYARCLPKTLQAAACRDHDEPAQLDSYGSAHSLHRLADGTTPPVAPGCVALCAEPEGDDGVLVVQLPTHLQRQRAVVQDVWRKPGDVIRDGDVLGHVLLPLVGFVPLTARLLPAYYSTQRHNTLVGRGYSSSPNLTALPGLCPALPHRAVTPRVAQDVEGLGDRRMGMTSGVAEGVQGVCCVIRSLCVNVGDVIASGQPVAIVEGALLGPGGPGQNMGRPLLSHGTAMSSCVETCMEGGVRGTGSSPAHTLQQASAPSGRAGAVSPQIGPLFGHRSWPALTSSCDVWEGRRELQQQQQQLQKPAVAAAGQHGP